MAALATRREMAAVHPPHARPAVLAGGDGHSADLRQRLLSSGCMALLDGLDPGQLDAAVAGQGLTIIEAGAGTGKTRTLVTRIAALLGIGEDPWRIMAMTFTNDAARQMRHRAQAMGAAGVEGVRFCTMHAYAARMLRRHWDRAGLASPDFMIADPDERRALVAQAVDQCAIMGPRLEGEEASHDRERKNTIRHALSCIDKWKEAGLTTAMVLDPDRAPRSDAEEAIAGVYVAFEGLMANAGLLDFADLLANAVRLLELDAGVLDAEAAGLRWLMVDEGQDLNRLQMRMLACLSSLGANVTVVGDDDQSLYSWRGSIPNLMSRLESMLPQVAARGVNRARLVTNRRCTEQILVPANLLVDYNPRAEPKVLRSGMQGEPVLVLAHASHKAEAEDVARRIQLLIAAGTPAREIAVLVRNKIIADEIGNALIRHRIAHQMQAGYSLLERREVMDVLAYLKLAVDPGHALAFERIAAKPTRGMGPAAVKEVLGVASNRGISIHEALSALVLSNGLSGRARASAQRMALDLASLSESFRTGESSASMLDYVLNDIGYMAWARERDEHDSLESSIRTIAEMAADQPSLLELLTDTAISGDSEARTTDGVHVGTMHGSKGLEWDHVFLPGFENEFIPSPRALEVDQSGHDPEDPWNTRAQGSLEEERCIAHVAMTRARLCVVISFCAHRVVFGKPRTAQPSRLLHEAELKVPRVPRVQSAYGARGRAIARSSQRKPRAEAW